MIIYGKEKEILQAQKRSLAAWINNTIGATLVETDNLIRKLSTGVVLCKLAKCIQEKVDRVRGYYAKVDRLLQLKYWEIAKRETFFARDNAEMFIRWCKSFGVRDAVLFESDGLVLQTQPRTVVLCLLELSRLASKYGVLLPPPIQLPPTATITIRDDDASECSEDDDLFFATTIPSPTTKYQGWDSGCSSGPRSPSPISIYSKIPSPNSSLKRSSRIPVKKRDKNVVIVVRSRSDNQLDEFTSNNSLSSLCISSQALKNSSSSLRISSVALEKSSNYLRTSSPALKNSMSSPRISSPSSRRSLSLARTETISSRMRSNPNLNRSCSSIASSKAQAERAVRNTVPLIMQKKRSALDKRVLEVVRQCKKDETKVRRISEGHYSFEGKNLYARIVRGNNVVVRLGGGWDTLEHFLSAIDCSKGSSFYKHSKPSENHKQVLSFKNVSPY